MAIIADYMYLHIAKLFGHFIHFDLPIELPPYDIIVVERRIAYRTPKTLETAVITLHIDQA